MSQLTPSNKLYLLVVMIKLSYLSCCCCIRVTQQEYQSQDKEDDYRVSANAANHSADKQMIVVTDEQDKLIDKKFEPGDNEARCHVTVNLS